MDRPTRILHVLLVSALLVSIVHYVDNTVRFDDYAQGDAGPVTRPMIPLAWALLTAAGFWGYLQYRRGRFAPAALGLAVYSTSGLVSPVHYTAAAPSAFDALQNTFIALDTILGVAILAFACWLALRRGATPAASTT